MSGACWCVVAHLAHPACFAGRTIVGGMETFLIGNLSVHRIGFGAMQLPGRGVMGPPRDREEALAVLRRAIELGVDHIDTAQYYGPDVSNELIRAALYPYPENLVLVSKVGAFRDERGVGLAVVPTVGHSIDSIRVSHQQPGFEASGGFRDPVGELQFKMFDPN